MHVNQPVDGPSKSEDGLQSLTELFHLVKSLIPEDQELITASPDMSVGEAVQLMQEHNFSQLPVVAGKAVLGVFSFRSLTRQLLKLGPIKEDFGTLPVDEFMEHFKFVQPSDSWESVVDSLNRDNGVLVGHRDRLEGIVTAMDVLNYLREVASPFVVLAEIERSLRRIIRACVNEDGLQKCIQNSLASKYEPEEMPTQLSEMTFNDYIQIIGDGRNWPHFAAVFGQGEWQRKTTTERLKEIRDLRNDVFHFKRQLSQSDTEILNLRREWLQMKARAFQAKKQKITPEEPPIKPIQKWDAPSFFQELEAKRGKTESAIARKILAWAESQMPSIYWGEGKKFGCFIPGLNHNGLWHQLVGIWTNGYIEVQFQYMKPDPPFDEEAKRLEFLRRLNQIPGVSLPEDTISRRPSIPLAALRDETALARFLEVLNWAVQEIQAT